MYDISYDLWNVDLGFVPNLKSQYEGLTKEINF